MANSIVLLPGSSVVSDPAFLVLGFAPQELGEDGPALSERRLFNLDRALGILKENPDLGAKFLGSASGNGSVYWAGAHAEDSLDGRSVGVRIVTRRSGEEAYGDNIFGKFLTEVRDAYRLSIRETIVQEVPVEVSRITTDFTPRGAFMSDVEAAEKTGLQYIHTDIYRPARFRFDASMNGTTGHAQRDAAEDVSFHSFECPFGTAYPSPVIVGSAAEASLLYERALRGELDWKALFTDLSDRGLLNKNLSERQKASMISDYRAQFAWMREQIATNADELRRRPIVAASRMVPDDSMGRSQYDAVFAPSPADVLERYIHNPILLFSASENGVLRSLAAQEKNEPVRFHVKEGVDEMTVLVVGSDTIGGREEGGRATSRRVVEMERDAEGNKVFRQTKRFELPLKTKEEQEADYRAFSVRMDEILSELPEGMRVRLVTGNSSSQGVSVGVGTPRMVERYVREHGGSQYAWDYVRHGAEPVRDRNGASLEGEGRLSSVTMEHFAEAYPVLLGRSEKVSFLLNDDDPSSDVTFSMADGLSGSAAVCLSVKGDAYNRNVLSMGSLAASEGLPVVHVQEKLSEEEQRQALRFGAVRSLGEFSGDLIIEEPLFRGEETRQWAVGEESNVLSYMEQHDMGMVAIPDVSQRSAVGATVSGYSFRSAYGLYGALLAGEMGKADAATLLDIRRAEGDTGRLNEVIARVTDGAEVAPDVQEKCLRRAVRLLADADSSFAESLLELDGRPVVMPVTVGGDMTLFCSVEGEGLNRFGVVLSAESERMKVEREARVAAALDERKKILDEAARRQRVLDGRKADGEKVRGGLPVNGADAAGAVWFLGTNSPVELMLPDDEHSFDMWDDMGGDDRLVRGKAMAARLDDGDGGKFENNYVFLFPTDMASVTGRRSVSPRADSTNLTDCKREDPKTGEKFTCAFGIPVRLNNLGIEPRNNEGMPTSYRLDNEASSFTRSVILADSQARVQAIRHGMALCMPGRIRSDGSKTYTVGQVFMDKTWTRKEGWTDNPHRAPLNYELTQRYVSFLERGENFPLNLIPLPKESYSVSDAEVQSETGGVRMSAEGRFLADLNLSLQIASATALSLGVPLRFPLDENGHIDLGPGVPEQFRSLAEKKIDSFIGVVRSEEILDGELSFIERLDTKEALQVRSSTPLKKTDDIYLAPNDLVPAFGQYDFRSILNSGTAPLHEMMFRMGDDYFYLVDSRLNRGMDLSEVNKYLSYEKNDVCRFRIMSSNPDRVAEFKSVLGEYVARARGVEVEMRLVQEGEKEARGLSYEGFVNLLDSNSEQFAESEHDIGREATVYNAVGRVGVDGGVEDRDVNGEKNSGVYYGRTDAKDGFAGYAQIRYSYDGGEKSGWTTVDDLDLAKDIVMKLVNRKYASMDERVVPSDRVMDMLLKAEAFKRLLSDGTVLEKGLSTRVSKQVDDKVVDIERTQEETPSVDEKPVRGVGARVKTYSGDITPTPDTVFVFGSNPEGRHGAGAAKVARTQFGAVYGQGEGLQGQAYAIPTKDLRVKENKGLRSIPEKDIVNSIRKMYDCAREHPDKTFKVAYRNTDEVSLNGYTGIEMIGMFIKAGPIPGNVAVSEEWMRTGLFDSLGEGPSAGLEPVEPKAPGEAPAPDEPGGRLPDDYKDESEYRDELSYLAYTQSTGSYAQRTDENANAPDVDFTLAFAVDFSTYGEKRTERAAGDSYIPVDIPVLEKGGIDLSSKAVSKVVTYIVKSLPEEFVNGEACGLNIAGNGIYTLAGKGITQEQSDEFVLKVMRGLQKKGVLLSSLRSGGQTGIDQSGAVAGVVLDIPTIVHTTKDWRFRGVDNKDVMGEAAFKERFEKTDYERLRKMVASPKKKFQQTI